MPLLTSPIDGAPMKQIKRYGIEIDLCPSTGGIWLDKGELEKLMAFLKEEARGERDFARDRDGAPAGRFAEEDEDEGSFSSRRGANGQGGMSRIMELFDF